jgi:hypothetical protein
MQRVFSSLRSVKPDQLFVASRVNVDNPFSVQRIIHFLKFTPSFSRVAITAFRN